MPDKLPADQGERTTEEIMDLCIIGGGVNGCGIARDAAGRGLSVVLAEMHDLAGATSSASTKLFHGGLRYLEYFELRLVHEALAEREILLAAMPHISWPLRFVIPYDPLAIYDSDTPTSRMLGLFMPWFKGKRPAWMIRMGLFLYDNLGGRRILQSKRVLGLRRDEAGLPLRDDLLKAFEYSDCWVQDSRLVVLNARDARERGATILPRHRVTQARREGGIWSVDLQEESSGKTLSIRARMLVNAGGPWVEQVIRDVAGVESHEHIRLVRGSHIVVPRLYDHNKCYLLQRRDGRVVFALPFEEDYTLIGTTEVDHPNPDELPTCSPEEAAYLCEAVSESFTRKVTPADIVWSYAGVRPLFDEGKGSATATTRDYVLKIEGTEAPLLNVFGGKITTYRRLSELAVDKVTKALGKSGARGHWTRGASLPGGNFPVDGFEALVKDLGHTYPFLKASALRRLVRAYGTEVSAVFGDAKGRKDLGESFGDDLTEREVRWLMDKEFAQTAEDVIWRRSKLGLRLSAEAVKELDDWMKVHRG